MDTTSILTLYNQCKPGKNDLVKYVYTLVGVRGFNLLLRIWDTYDYAIYIFVKEKTK